MAKLTKILNGKYEVIGVKPGPIGTKIGVLDLSMIDENTAEKLVKAGTSYLRKSKPVTKKKRNI
tara:strand:+ start:521 stop:712 length:192 start_codon:yes stop_codon:yes gene_type:complete